MRNIQDKYTPDFIIGSELAYDHKDIQLLLKTIKYFKKYDMLYLDRTTIC